MTLYQLIQKYGRNEVFEIGNGNTSVEVMLGETATELIKDALWCAGYRFGGVPVGFKLENGLISVSLDDAIKQALCIHAFRDGESCPLCGRVRLHKRF